MPIQSPESEKYVLCAMVNHAEALATGCNELVATSFYDLSHQEIFQACSEFYRDNLRLNFEELTRHLEATGKLSRIGGVQFLSFILSFTRTENLNHHLKVVKDRALLRTLHRKLVAATEDVQSATEAAPFLESLLRGFSEIEGGNDEVESHDLNAFFRGEQGDQGTLEAHLEAKQTEAKLRKPGELYLDGLPTTYTDLDRMFQGLKPGTLHIIGGRSSMGKTTFALNIARNLCCQHKLRVGIVSYEMSFRELWPKFLAAQAEVSEFDLNSGNFKRQEIQRMLNSQAQFAQGSIQVRIPFSSNLTFARSVIRRLVQQDACELIVIDYLQKISASAENRYQEVSKVSLALGMIARQLKVPILCLAQLSRKPEGRGDGSPVLSDLRDSGAIEQDADTVSLIYRPDYYDQRRPAGESQIIVAKNRKGPTGTVKLAFNSAKSLFSSYADEDDARY